ncbi:hypothetical protein EVAR_41316_1 [Eumeta japonica]|uniref:Uncharacterized protein n=1 Tax=Eumeta variegata TaxID=151549 RepID=A0A4C1X2P3_EUMVA|nr:hypothetical protein EVAR_41316_1 [Eumeta japonica]
MAVRPSTYFISKSARPELALGSISEAPPLTTQLRSNLRAMCVVYERVDRSLMVCGAIVPRKYCSLYTAGTTMNS